MSSQPVDLGPWEEARAIVGLDDPLLLRAPAIRAMVEEAHALHEQRRAAHGRIVELESLLAAAQSQLDISTAAGLDVLQSIHGALRLQSAAMDAAISGLAHSLEAPTDRALAAGGDQDHTQSTAAELIDRFQLDEQFEGLLDMLTMQGLYNPRGGTVQVQDRGRNQTQSVPPFERVSELLLTDELCSYVGDADHLQLLLTPAADSRVVKGIGRIIGFNDYTIVGSSDRTAVSRFVEKLSTSAGKSVVDHLLERSPIPGMAVGLYAEYRIDSDDGIEGLGMSLTETEERLLANISDAEAHGVSGRAMSPPEYMMIQAMRQRSGEAFLDDADRNGESTETWFPGLKSGSGPGTLVSRRTANSVRFRLDELGRGSPSRGHRMVYAPAA